MFNYAPINAKLKERHGGGGGGQNCDLHVFIYNLSQLVKGQDGNMKIADNLSVQNQY